MGCRLSSTRSLPESRPGTARIDSRVGPVDSTHHQKGGSAQSLLALVPISQRTDLLTLSWLTTIVLLAVSWWDLRRGAHPVTATAH